MSTSKKTLDLSLPATIHLIGICGTGMGALAGLLKEKGYSVTGSDAHAYPPMSTELARLGIAVKEGYAPANLDHQPDLVVVGNVCRPDHVEAAAAKERRIPYASMPSVVRDLFLKDKESLVIAGTHGKTTTTALTAFLLYTTGRDPSMLVGGVTEDFGLGFRLGGGAEFVIEGDEYDSAYFEKYAKFLSYEPKAAVITSVEYDHIDIYKSFEAYREAFLKLAQFLPAPGPIAVFAGDPHAVAIARESEATPIRYGVTGDTPEEKMDWMAKPTEAHTFELFIQGRFAGRVKTPLLGVHNLRNTLAAMILCHVKSGVPLQALVEALPLFKGVARRQQVLGHPNGITLYDDFAHHPTAVRETLSALKANHNTNRLIAAFEPRSATACRRLHQDRYARAFDAADKAIIAPVGRDLPEDERLDTQKLAEDLRANGIDAVAATSIDEVSEIITEAAEPGDGVVLLSNGGFGGLGQHLLSQLT
jgi:UDP-N-acetylmuramate: L-alanyl-gamma-D-glutamyl-meso-diaminopimelate ligase